MACLTASATLRLRSQVGRASASLPQLQKLSFALQHTILHPNSPAMASLTFVPPLHVGRLQPPRVSTGTFTSSPAPLLHHAPSLPQSRRAAAVSARFITPDPLEKSDRNAVVTSPSPSPYSVDPYAVDKDAEENMRGFVKTRGSLVPGEEVLFWWSGDIYGLVEDQPNRHLFNFEGYNIGRMVPVAGGWRLLTREVGIYRDPVTREILSTVTPWRNPYTGADNDVIHCWNDPVNQQFLIKGGEGKPLFGGVPSTLQGEDLYWHAEISLAYPSPLPASRYPSAARTDTYHSLEMFQFFVKTNDLEDDTPSADCQISWTRVGQWLPWMEMGNRPGRLIYHCRGKKLKGGYGELSPSMRAYVESKHPEYMSAPTDFTRPNETSWSYFKKILEAKGTARADGTVASVEDAPTPVVIEDEKESGAGSGGNLGEKLFTREELASYNGEDVHKPIYISLGGLVFDVSSAKRHYRSGETYNCLTGRDSTCAFVSGDLSKEGLAKGSPSANDLLSEKESEDLKNWILFFAKSYPRVGRLV